MNKFLTKEYWNDPPTKFEFGLFIGGIIGSGLTILATGIILVMMT